MGCGNCGRAGHNLRTCGKTVSQCAERSFHVKLPETDFLWFQRQCRITDSTMTREVRRMVRKLRAKVERRAG